MVFKMKGFPRYSAQIASETKVSSDNKNKEQGRWKERQALIKKYIDSGKSRKEAIKIARQSLPKKWGKHKGSW